nr:hypothetical protein [Halarchaeum grantii]
MTEFRDVYVRLRADLLVIGDSVVTDRHHASSGNYEPEDPQNQIGGIIPAFSLSGWLRHGMERVVQERGGTACHPGRRTQGSGRRTSTRPTSMRAITRRGVVSTTTTTAVWCLSSSVGSGIGRAK